MLEPLDIDGNVVLPAGELAFTAVRSSGPGGQNVNKVSSKVELTWDFGASQVLNQDQKDRLFKLAGRRIDGRGVLHVVCQETRDQRENLMLARARLALLVASALKPPRKRKRTRPSRGANERRLAEKKRHGEKKRQREI